MKKKSKKKKNKNFENIKDKIVPGVIILAVVVGVGIFGYLATRDSQNKSSQTASLKDQASQEKLRELKVPAASGDWSKGPADAPVTIVEYSDFKCPACRFAKKTFDEILPLYEGKVRYIYRHYPISSLHPTAKKLAEAAEAAGVQGKFWEMHDLIFDNQEDATAEKTVEFAGQLGLDVNKFKSELESGKYEKKVEEDIDSGDKSDVNATPTIFVNGKQFLLSRSTQEFKDEIERILNEQK